METNKPRIKFHVEENQIVHSGAGDIIPPDEVCRMMEGFFEDADKSHVRIAELEHENTTIKDAAYNLMVALEVFNKIKAEKFKPRGEEL